MKNFKLMAIIASVFSIVFSFTIVQELKAYVDIPTFILMSVFILFVLIVNESFKVQELAKYFRKESHSKTIIISTLIISVVLSCIGIYFRTNKTQEKEMENAELAKTKLLSIELRYNDKIDSVANATLSSEVYKLLIEDIEYWRTRGGTAEQRKIARANGLKSQQHKIKMEGDFNDQKLIKIKRLEKLKSIGISSLNVSTENKQKIQNKGRFLYYIFFVLVLLVEAMIVVTQSKITSFFTKEQKINYLTIKNLFKNKRTILEVNDIRFNPIFNPKGCEDDKLRDKAVSLWFLLGNLGIIHKHPDHKNEVLDSKSSYKILKKFYESVNEKI